MGKQSDAAITFIIIIAFAAGFAINSVLNVPVAQILQEFVPVANETEFRIPASEEFVVASISLIGTSIGLQNGCYEIGFDITEDQAFSIRHGLDGTMSARPLTHDILRDIIEDFGIKILNLRIERFGEEIYYARMFVQQGSKILDIDMRPSDAIALSLKTKNKLYINETMLKEKGDNVCLEGV